MNNHENHTRTVSSMMNRWVVPVSAAAGLSSVIGFGLRALAPGAEVNRSVLGWAAVAQALLIASLVGVVVARRHTGRVGIIFPACLAVASSAVLFGSLRNGLGSPFLLLAAVLAVVVAVTLTLSWAERSAGRPQRSVF